MSGNMHVQRAPVGSGDHAAMTKIDCNRTASGDMTHERTINGQKCYFTESGAKAFDEEMQNLQDNPLTSSKLEVKDDPSAISQFFDRFLGRPEFKETHVGNPTSK